MSRLCKLTHHHLRVIDIWESTICQEKLLMCISWCRYSSKFVKGYIEASKPRLAVGEYWDTCSYVGPKYTLDYNQGWFTLIFHLTIIVFNFWIGNDNLLNESILPCEVLYCSSVGALAMLLYIQSFSGKML